MKIYKEEIFGRVLAVASAKSRDEAAEMISAHEFGSASAIVTSNGDAAGEFVHQIQTG